MKPWGSGLPDPLPAGLRRMLPYLSGSPWPEIYPGAPASTQHYTLPGESSGDRWAVLVACRAGTSGEEDGEGGDLPVRMRQERCPNCCLAGGAAWAVLPGSRRCRRCSALCGPLGSKGGSWAVEWRGVWPKELRDLRLRCGFGCSEVMARRSGSEPLSSQWLQSAPALTGSVFSRIALPPGCKKIP